MPTGKVKLYDAEKGFGFLSDDEGGDVFLHANALPEGSTALKSGTRVEFGIVEGRRGAQALSVRVLDPAPSIAAAARPPNASRPTRWSSSSRTSSSCSTTSPKTLRRGQYPDKQTSTKVAACCAPSRATSRAAGA